MASLTEANKVVDTLVQKIYAHAQADESSIDFKINEIIKGGSLGHGTPVFSNHDVDLVVYSSDIKLKDIREAKKKEEDDDDDDEELSGYEQWLKKLKEFLSQNFPNINPEIDYRSVKFTFRGINVDLLVSPYWGEDQHKLYRDLLDIPAEERKLFTVCASKWQVIFFKDQPPQVKEHIRKAKQWRNENWPDESRLRPSSYLMSLLVVAAYEQNPRNVTQAIKDLVQQPHLDIYWETFYKESKYPLPSRPRVVDPANPFNNVWRSGTGLESYIDTIRL